MTSRNLFGDLVATEESKPLRFSIPAEKVSNRLEKYATGRVNITAKPKMPAKQNFIRTATSKPAGKPKATVEVSKVAARGGNYKEMLKYSRNYAQLMEDLDNGTVPINLIPAKREAPKDNEPPPEKKEKLFAISQFKLHKDDTEKPKSGRLKKGAGLMNGPEIWCARCSKKHPADFHKKKPKPPPRPVIAHPHHLSGAKSYGDEYDSEDEEASDMSDFIESDEDVAPSQISQTIRKMYGYDPSRYRHLDEEDDLAMEASADTILREEKISAKIGAREDKEEFMRNYSRSGHKR